ncbi:MAG: hypothetical protein U0840_26450 [Gemmataceae bacterium]
MAKKKSLTEKPKSPPPPEPSPVAVTADRFRRLYRLVSLLHSAAHSRPQITKLLDLDVRGFYRDLEFIRTLGIPIRFTEGAYYLEGALERAVELLPFPDPHLTLGEMQQLARGRSRLHALLQARITELLD